MRYVQKPRYEVRGSVDRGCCRERRSHSDGPRPQAAGVDDPDFAPEELEDAELPVLPLSEEDELEPVEEPPAELSEELLELSELLAVSLPFLPEGSRESLR